MDLTPAEKIGSETYACWLAMPNRGAYVRSFVGAAARDAYQAGREDAARDIAEAIERANDAGAWAGVEQPGPAVLAYDHAAGLARMYRVPDCGGEYHGADGGPCSRCGFDVADLADQPRTVEEAVGDNPEEQRP